MKNAGLAAALLLSVAGVASSKDLGCSGPDNWAASMVFVNLKNAGLLRNDEVDFAKTKVRLIASEKIGKDLYRQVHEVTYFRKDGSTVSAIASNEASSEECSMTGVEVYVISKHLGAAGT